MSIQFIELVSCSFPLRCITDGSDNSYYNCKKCIPNSDLIKSLIYYVMTHKQEILAFFLFFFTSQISFWLRKWKIRCLFPAECSSNRKTNFCYKHYIISEVTKRAYSFYILRPSKRLYRPCHCLHFLGRHLFLVAPGNKNISLAAKFCEKLNKTALVKTV